MTENQVKFGKRDQIEKFQMVQCKNCGRTMKELSLNAPEGVINDKLNEFSELRCSECKQPYAKTIY